MGALSSTNRVLGDIHSATRSKSGSISARECCNQSVSSEDSFLSHPNRSSLFFLLPVEIQKWIANFLEFQDLLSLRFTCFSFLLFIDFHFVQLNIPVRFLALHKLKNVKKFERASSSYLWSHSKDYILSRKRSVSRYGLRFHSFGLMTSKFIKESLPLDLHHLWIQSCRLDRNSVSAFPPLLKQLIIKDCKTLKDAHLLQLPSSLEFLILFKCANITDEGVKNLCAATRDSLRHLDLTCNLNFSNEIFQYLPPKLDLLELSSCKRLSDHGIVKYGLPSMLRSLSINCIDAMTNSILSKIPTSITYLDLVHTNMKLTEEFQTDFPSLREVRLCSCNGITRTSLEYLRPNLERLSLMHCKSLLTELCDFIPANLRTLSLYGSATNEILMKIPQSVVELDLAASKVVTDEGLEHIAGHSNIRMLRLDELSITTKSMRNLPPQLQELSISKCPLLKDSDLDHLPITIFKLTALDCPLITAHGIIKLQQQRRNLITVMSYPITREILRSKFSEERFGG